jgi:hypothetical protein
MADNLAWIVTLCLVTAARRRNWRSLAQREVTAARGRNGGSLPQRRLINRCSIDLHCYWE